MRTLSCQTAQGPRRSLDAPDPPRGTRFSAAPRRTGLPWMEDGPSLLPQPSPQGPGESSLLIPTSDVLCPSLRTWSGCQCPRALIPLGAEAKPRGAERGRRLSLLHPHSGAVVRSVQMLLYSVKQCNNLNPWARGVGGVNSVDLSQRPQYSWVSVAHHGQLTNCTPLCHLPPLSVSLPTPLRLCSGITSQTNGLPSRHLIQGLLPENTTVVAIRTRVGKAFPDTGYFRRELVV